MAAAMAAWVSPGAWAQGSAARGAVAWPRQPVNVVVPFPAGGTSALLAKQLVVPFQAQTQQAMRLHYHSGQAGSAGAAYAATLPPDGHHLLMGGSFLLAARALQSDESFDFVQELRPMALVAKVPMVVLVNPARMRARNASEWLSEVGRKPALYRMASAGVGSSSHVAAEIVRAQTGAGFEFVHFRGAGPALQDVLTGAVDMMFDGVASCIQHIRTGRLRAVMVTGPERLPALPDVPCAAELDIDGLSHYQPWYGLFAPKQLPSGREAAIVRTLQQLGQGERLRANLAGYGVTWGGVYGAAFAEMVEQETWAWAQRIKQLGLQGLLKSTASDEG